MTLFTPADGRLLVDTMMMSVVIVEVENRL